MSRSTKHISVILRRAGLPCVALLVVYSCKQAVKAPQAIAEKKPEHTFAVNGSVREMNIWPEMVEFPEHPGKTEFTTYCGICHSLRYITQQPDFSRETWHHEVDKMVTKYGAPIDSAVANRIVDYLVAVKGTK